MMNAVITAANKSDCGPLLCNSGAEHKENYDAHEDENPIHNLRPTLG